MATVRVITTEVSPFSLETTASTWGELKRELRNRLSNIDNMTVVLSTTKATLDLDDAALPQGVDYKIYFSPKAIKQGNANINIKGVLEALRDNFESMIEELIEEIEDGVYEQEDNSTSTHTPIDSDLEELQSITRNLG